MAKVSAIDDVGQALWECDMPPMKFPPTTKGDYSLSAQGSCELPKGHTFLYVDDAQAGADELNPPYKRRCRSRRSVHMDAGFSQPMQQPAHHPAGQTTMRADDDCTQLTQASQASGKVITDTQSTARVNDSMPENESLPEDDMATHEEQPLDDDDL